MSLTRALGLSRRSVSHPLSAPECPASRMSGRRAVQEAGKAARGTSKWATGRTPVIGADETIVKARGKAKLVGFVADAKSGELLGIYMPVERDSEGSLTGSKGMLIGWE